MKNYKRQLMQEGLQAQQAKALLSYMQRRNLSKAIRALEKQRRQEEKAFYYESAMYQNRIDWALNTVDFIAFQIENKRDFESAYYALSEFVKNGHGWPALNALVFDLYRLRKIYDRCPTQKQIDEMEERALIQCQISIEECPDVYVSK